MLPQKQLERARNMLSLVLWHDALDKEPRLFFTELEAHEAVFSAGVLYWLFGDDAVHTHCECHESTDTKGFLEVMRSRLKEAGYGDPESDEVYQTLKRDMSEMGLNLFGVLYHLRVTNAKEPETAPESVD